MKKLVCLVLVLAMCASIAAMAESVPSKTVADLTRFEVTAENQPGDENIYLLPVNEVTMGEMQPESQELIDICQKEIEKLSASETVESYFGEVTDAEGNVVDLRMLLDAQADETLNVFEFCPIIAGGFRKDCGKVTATMLFSTPYEEGEKVLVLIGLVTVLEDNTQEVVWQAFEGVGIGVHETEEETYGGIRVELTQEIVVAIQESMALMAIVSK